MLDPATLLFCVAMFAYLMAAMAYSASRASRSTRGALLLWTQAMACGGTAFLLYFLHGVVPRVLSFGVAHVLVLMLPRIGLAAHARLFRAGYPEHAAHAIAAVGVAAVLAHLLLDLPEALSLAALHAAGAALLAMTAWLLWRQWVTRPASTLLLALLVVTAAALGFAARAVLGLLADPAMTAAMSTPGLQLLMQLLALGFVIAASMVFFALVHERQRREAVEALQRDSLTGVLTRTAFFERAYALQRRQMLDRCAVVIVDLDHFRSINDSHGHRGGDVVLSHVARRLVGAIRLADLLGRYGGEEFCILLADCSATDAQALAGRLVSDARSQIVRLPNGRCVAYTLSAGFAHWQRSPASAGTPLLLGELIDRADQALHLAKRSGRDRAVGAPTEPVGQVPRPRTMTARHSLGAGVR